MGTISLRRRSALSSVFREYHISVDGVKQGVVKSGQRLDMAVPPGEHVVEATIDWAGSQPLTITVERGGVVEVECITASFFKGVVLIYERPNDYLRLTVV